MSSLDQLQAFVAAADEGSFSAAARRLRKAQSAVSTAVINLEIDVGVELFDRTGRTPSLTAAGTALLRSARSVLKSNQEFLAHASSVSEGVETQLCIAVEQGMFLHSLTDILLELGERFPFVEVEILDPGINDVPSLLKEGRADIGMMLEQEDHPQGFHFRGVGYSRMVPVCGRDHPLAGRSRVSHGDLRHHRQLMMRSRTQGAVGDPRDQKGAKVWFSESPYVILELLLSGLGWAVLPKTVVSERLRTGDLVRLRYGFQETDVMQGVDVVWTERRALGSAGQWLLNKLLALKPGLWSD
ncbi:MAG: LysR family transcriptional regulator [Pseudomonadota bacterium]